ncbi:DUF2892 domain-containing protein [Pusillimonas sp. TS35]|uniref:rhodanese family protein n=1 Tax=Paracandidimonas lactea TaxID=2895524 RepID=UPI001371A9D0|nr:rhodanese family protein [Paracandidimonas lactea]MYN14506.1 DUF2892 domain-containing protein [Pusillimonas sp. TS35]
MNVNTLTPEAARQRLAAGAILVDIRSRDEFLREHIPQARNLPMEDLARQGLGSTDATAVIFHCRSGNRTRLNAATLASRAGCEAYVLEGGLDAWKKAGLPIEQDASQPMELQRQVQIAAGSLALGGTVLGVLVSPWFLAVPAFVGGGLILAGLSGFCGMARLLMKAPWNRRSLAR